MIYKKPGRTALLTLVMVGMKVKLTKLVNLLVKDFHFKVIRINNSCMKDSGKGVVRLDLVEQLHLTETRSWFQFFLANREKANLME